jgi:membrane protein required for colicin V production
MYPKWFDVFNLIPQMNWLDWLLISYIFAAILLGGWRGLVKEVFALVTWLISLTLALSYMSKLSNLLIQTINFPNIRLLAALLTLFMVAMILFGWFCDLIIQSMRLNSLSFTEQFLGMILGSVRGLFSIFLVIIVVSLTPWSDSPIWSHSILVQHIGYAADFIIKQLASEVTNQFQFHPALHLFSP